VVIVFFSWLERDNPSAFRLGDYLEWPRAILRVYGGLVGLGLLVLEVLLALLGAVVFVGARFLKSPALLQMSPTAKFALINGYWILPLLLLLPVAAVISVRDLFRIFFRATRLPRAFGTIIAGVAVGVVLSFVYYPALAAQLSPKEVFEAYGHMHHGSEPLGLLGVEARAASYESGGEVRTFSDANSAFGWLTGTPGRKWLALRSDDLPKLNSMYRGLPGQRGNLPVLDSRSSQILLVSNEIAPGETNKNPLASMVLDREPTPQHAVDTTFQDGLACLGWDVRDASGEKLVDAVTAGRKYRFRIYYKVGAKISGDWETFIHIDGQHRRFNGDHKTLNGKYAFYLWQPGDYIVDETDLTLEPNFTSGSYDVFLGLFVGETRLKVVSGHQDDNRIVAGTLRVQ
jgi:hypothetical protein